ncbi:MAG: hypothetical protein Q7I93_04890, partial [Syntrophales bacterium]|nr:hypothetical protein [Syntrophales bacterium]
TDGSYLISNIQALHKSLDGNAVVVENMTMAVDFHAHSLSPRIPKDSLHPYAFYSPRRVREAI